MTWEKAKRDDVDTRVAGGFGTPAGLRSQHLRAYQAWYAARRRCLESAHRQWAYYGGRGITMCDRWLSSFAAFLEDMGDPPAGLSLDRKDNDGPYSPANCKWSTRSEQQRNKRRRSHCLKGLHSMLDEANVYIVPGSGKTRCHQCMHDNDARRRAG